MAEMTAYEKRLAILEARVQALSAALASVANAANKAAQDAAQVGQQDQTPGQTVFECITTSAVTARVGTTMGSGSFQFVNSAGGTLTTLAGVGTFTGYNDNKNGWASGVYCKVVFMDGQWEFITADAC
jgi:hypothetical protein